MRSRLLQTAEFPSYRYRRRDVVLVEFEQAYRRAAVQSRLFAYFATVLVGGVTALGALEFVLGETRPRDLIATHPISVGATTVVVAYFLITFLAHLQRDIVNAQRKVIVLRRLLGFDLGSVEVVFPSTTFEGAQDPYVVKMRPRESSPEAFPHLVVVAIAAATIYHAAIAMGGAPGVSWLLCLSAALVLLRRHSTLLREQHESAWFTLARTVAWLSGVRLVDQPASVLLYAKRGWQELLRLNYNLEDVGHLVVRIEDQAFYRHRGTNYRSLVRAAYDFARSRFDSRVRPTGGSTISMQLARSLLITNLAAKRPARKVVEVLLAQSLERHLSKEQILGMYLASVRFDHNVLGIAAACRHFFNDPYLRDPDRFQTLLLVERLSNVSKTFSEARLRRLYLEGGVVMQRDFAALVAFYRGVALRVDLAETPRPSAA